MSSSVPKVSSTRCCKCNKKLGVMEYKCKCEKLFCITHLQPQEHNCEYDHRADAKAIIKSQLDIGPLSRQIDPI